MLSPFLEYFLSDDRTDSTADDEANDELAHDFWPRLLFLFLFSEEEHARSIA